MASPCGFAKLRRFGQTIVTAGLINRAASSAVNEKFTLSARAIVHAASTLPAESNVTTAKRRAAPTHALEPAQPAGGGIEQA
jgi:hypothetical protein